MCASHHASSFGVYQNLALQDYIETSLILLMQVTFCFVQTHHPVVSYIDLLENNGWLFWE